MNTNDKKTKGKTKTIKEIVSESKTLEEAQQKVAEQEEEEYSGNLIYNFFNFFIGGPNTADIKNRQTGKPPTY